MLEYWKTKKLTRGEEISRQEDALYDECHKIAERLKSDAAVEDIDTLEPNADDKTFKLLAESIKESIEKNSPEQALDRLHTFVVRYTRELCDRHGISYTSDTPLHSYRMEDIGHSDLPADEHKLPQEGGQPAA